MSAVAYKKEILEDMFRRVVPRNYSDTKYVWPQWFSELLLLRDAYDIIHIQIPVGAVILSWILHIVFWYLLAVYLDNINPGAYGAAKHWYYFFKVNGKICNTVSMILPYRRNVEIAIANTSFLETHSFCYRGRSVAPWDH